MTAGKPIAGGDAANPLVAFYEVYGRKREVLFLCSVPDTVPDTRDEKETQIFI
jgi:hypothetical protein